MRPVYKLLTPRLRPIILMITPSGLALGSVQAGVQRARFMVVGRIHFLGNGKMHERVASIATSEEFADLSVIRSEYEKLLDSRKPTT